MEWSRRKFHQMVLERNFSLDERKLMDKAIAMMEQRLGELQLALMEARLELVVLSEQKEQAQRAKIMAEVKIGGTDAKVLHLIEVNGWLTGFNEQWEERYQDLACVKEDVDGVVKLLNETNREKRRLEKRLEERKRMEKNRRRGRSNDSESERHPKSLAISLHRYP